MSKVMRVLVLMLFIAIGSTPIDVVQASTANHAVGAGSSNPATFINAFNRAGGAPRIGSAINNVHGWNAGCIQDFRGGLSAEAAIMQANCRGPAYFVIYGQWAYLVRNWGGNATNVVGYPTNDAYRNGAGWYQNFAGGSWVKTVIAKADSINAERSVRGNILNYWLANGGATGKFRYPLTDSYPNNGGHRQDFEWGSIFWSVNTGSITIPPSQPVATKERRAADWAIAEKNSANPSWSDEFGRAWSGYCEGFVEVAFGTRGQFASAYGHYQWQLSQGRIRTNTSAPVGAVVFYDSVDYNSAGQLVNYGHSGISIGSGQVVSTQGYNGQRLPVWQHGITGLSVRYLGWAYAPPNWPGR